MPSKRDLGAEVEKALTEALSWGTASPEEKDQRLKVIGHGIKLMAVKAKLTTAEHGLGFIDEDEEN